MTQAVGQELGRKTRKQVDKLKSEMGRKGITTVDQLDAYIARQPDPRQRQHLLGIRPHVLPQLQRPAARLS